MRRKPASLQPAPTHPSPYGLQRGASSSVNTCLGSAAVTTASPSLDPAASRMLEQYLACVALHGWGRLVFETCRGQEHFCLSCQPSNNTSDAPRPSRARAYDSLLRPGCDCTRLTCAGGSGKSQGGLPGSRVANSAPEPQVALPQQASALKLQLPKKPQQQQQQQQPKKRQQQ
jgi:hypothetical protein